MTYSEHDNYDASRGPVPTPKGGARKSSPKQMRMPVDLTRSRSVGLTADACIGCGARRDQGIIEHHVDCEVDVAYPGAREDYMLRIRTGALAANETSLDTGWFR